MKKILSFLAVIFLVGTVSVKAQSASDSSYARDLSYRNITLFTFPYTYFDSITTSCKILKDFRMGCYAKGYSFTLNNAALLNIKTITDWWDSHLFLLDSNFNLISENEFYGSSGYGSRIVRRLEPGTYHLLACERTGMYENVLPYILTIDTMFVPDYRTLYFEPRPFGTTFTDSLVNGGTLVTVRPDKVVLAKGYSITIPACTYMADAHSLQRQIYLLDSNNNFVTSVYGDYRKIIVPQAQAGTYKFMLISTVDFEEDYTVYDPFTVSLDSIRAATFATLNYRSVNIGDTIVDSIVATDPYLLYSPINHLYFKSAKNAYNLSYAKGYSFNTSAGDKYLDLNLFNVDSQGFPYFYILDSNKRIVYEQSVYLSYNRCMRVQPSSRYYIVQTTSVYETNRDFGFSTHASSDLPTFYVDALNGNDDSNGLSPTTAKRTIESIKNYSHRDKARIYLTEDYHFASDCYMGDYTELYPYGKNIRLTVGNGLSEILFGDGDLVMGKNGDSLFFTIDSVSVRSLFFNNSRCGYMEINNLKLLHSNSMLSMVSTDSLILNNCQIVGDTFGSPFGGRQVRLSGTTYSNNEIGLGLLSGNSFYFENSTIENNKVYYVTALQSENGKVELKSGTIRNNVVDLSTRPELELKRAALGVRPENMAGLIIASNVQLTIGSAFSLDTGAYIYVDSTASVNVSENITAPIAAKLYPILFDENTGDVTPDYHQGRRMLHGDQTMLMANYTHFAIVQPTNQTWYLHNNGCIYTSQQGTAQAECADVVFYPNPASDRFVVELNGTEADEICLFDIYGKQVRRISASQGANSIGVQDFARGIYFVQVRKNGTIVATRKLVKN